MIVITPDIAIAEDEIEEKFIRSPGAGGQNVNKTATAVQLRYDARHSEGLPTPVFLRLKALAGRRMTREGVVIIEANRFRTQEQNREDALERLVALLREAAVPPKRRRPTRPTKGSKERRLDSKRRRSDIKKGRRGTFD